MKYGKISQFEINKNKFSHFDIAAAFAEVDKHIKIKRINHGNNPLQFWFNMKNKFHVLSKLARLYLLALPSSITSEREFKIGKSMQSHNII